VQVTDRQATCTFTSDVVLGHGRWSLVVLKDKILLLGSGLGLEGVVLGQPKTKAKDSITANCCKDVNYMAF